ncbi:MAG: HD domain-containing protein [Solirubrobacteraceae bacterium]|nr:HD domain-containing protein [Solirubrobacteraceae bacterium]
MDLGNADMTGAHRTRGSAALAGAVAPALAHWRNRQDPRDHAQLTRDLRTRLGGHAAAVEAGLRVVVSPEVRRLTSLAESVDGGSPEHSRRVGRAAEAVAARMGLDAHFIALIRDAAPLHDVGKLEIPMSVLDKPGALTTRERVVMQRHAEAGQAICDAAGDDAVLRMAARIARSHHERWDGRGYPDGLSFDRIPLAARIVAVVDVYDALVAERPYKGAWSPSRALEFLRENAGTQFDPDVVEAFVSLAERDELGA